MYKHLMQEGIKCIYHENDSLNLEMQCFVSFAFPEFGDVVDGHEQLLDNNDIAKYLT